MHIYYLTGSQFALSNIALKRIKISRFSDLNDPFELLAVDISDRELRDAFRSTKKKINDDKGLICFSRSWKNPVIWGHYAEKHTGICLGFDVPDNIPAPVIYAPKLLKIERDKETNKPILTEDIINKLLRTKFSDWKYEDELRIFVELDHSTIESGKYFYPFSESFVLREVILGPQCELPIAGIREMVKSFTQSVKVLKSRIAFSRFEVRVNKVASKLPSKG